MEKPFNNLHQGFSKLKNSEMRLKPLNERQKTLLGLAKAIRVWPSQK